MPTIKAQLETLHGARQTAIDEANTLLAQDEVGPEDLETVDQLHAAVEEHDKKIEELLERDRQISARLEKANGFADHSDAIEGARGVHVGNEPQAMIERPKIPAAVRRYSTLRNFTGTVDGVQPEERAYRFGQWCMAKLAIDMPGKFNFPHAFAFAREQFGFGMPYAVSQEGGSGTDGAHVFVPDEFGMDLIRLRELYGVARGLFRMRTMTSDIRTDPRRTGGLTSYYVGESATGTESTAAYDSVTLSAKKLMIITRMSSELAEDAVIDFGDELAGEISYAFSNSEDEAAFNGDGTSTYGGIQGVRNRLDTLTAGTAPGLVLGAGNAYSELTLANFEVVVGGLPIYADVPGQVFWVCHKTFYYTVMASLSFAQGGSTSMELVEGLRNPLFMGYPVRFSQVMPSTEANDQIPVAFGNFAQGASFGDRRQETISFSDQASVGGQSTWERDQIAIKGTQRFDIAVHDFGTDSEAGPICGLQMAGS